MNLCVFGSASAEIDPLYIEAIEQFGEMMVDRGHRLVFGAGGNGLMGAAARGVYRKGGYIYGVIPAFFRDEEIEAIFDHCSELLYTEDMADRKEAMENRADAFVITPGGIGTFEEFFQVLTAKQLGRHTKPIAIYDVNGYYKELIALLDYSVAHKFVRADCKQLYFVSDNAEDIFHYIENDDQRKRSVKDLKNG